MENVNNMRIYISRFGSGNMDGFNMIGLLLPGVAVTYNGEEIGERNIGIPMNWPVIKFGRVQDCFYPMFRKYLSAQICG